MQLLANTTSPFVRIARVALIEKGFDLDPVIVDPWADDTRLRAANAATRVPTLVLDDGTPLTEALLIVQWLETERPAPESPSLLGPASAAAGVLSRAGVAMGAIEAAVVTIITRKAYGGAYDVISSKHLRGDVNFAWPNAEIAVMGAQGAVNILYRKELAGADNVDVKRAELITDYTEKFSNPYLAAERGTIDSVIEPEDSRQYITKAFRTLKTKRDVLPARKHGNIPL
jgi:glutathione S-transferase